MTSANFSENECFNVLWKIKNFTYFCGTMESPEFFYLRNRYTMQLNNTETGNPVSYLLSGECNQFDAYLFNSSLDPTTPMRISILTCDGSPEESREFDRDVAFSVPKDVIFGNRRSSFLPEDTLTVQLQIVTTVDRGKFYIYSQIGVKSKYFLWPLQNFSNNKNTSKIHPRPTKIFNEAFSLGKCQLALIPSKSSQCCSIQISSRYNGTCCCILKVSILNINGEALNCMSEEFVIQGHDLIKIPLNLNKKNSDAFRTMFLPNDTLSLRCYFAVSEGKVNDETSVICYSNDITISESFCEDGNSVAKLTGGNLKIFEEKSNSDYSTELQSKLKSILDNGTLSDVTLQIGTDVIQAHKCILSARSPVFRAMFSKEMLETISNTVVIEDFDMYTMSSFLQYVYTDTVDDYHWQTLKQLYIAADKYDVPSLKAICISRLETKLSVTNVCEALVFADFHQDSRLKAAAIDYISEYDDVVFSTKAWKKFEKSNSALAIQVLRAICCCSNKRIRLS